MTYKSYNYFRFIYIGICVSIDSARHTLRSTESSQPHFPCKTYARLLKPLITNGNVEYMWQICGIQRCLTTALNAKLPQKPVTGSWGSGMGKI